jgi:hypothetical protein
MRNGSGGSAVGENIGQRGIGQHRSLEGAPGDTGQRHPKRDPMLGREPVPPSPADGDLNTVVDEAE